MGVNGSGDFEVTSPEQITNDTCSSRDQQSADFGAEPAANENGKSRQTRILETKHYIRTKVRDDWSWPEPDSRHDVPPDENVSVWRERESDVEETERVAWPNASQDKVQTSPLHQAEHLARRRERREQLMSEVQYNTGLCTWLKRRDAWTRARYLPLDHNMDLFQAEPATELESPKRYMRTCLVPQSAPLLPDHHFLRRNIKASAYQSLYTKIVVQSQTPTIPINLCDMMSAIVQGWKADGEWPPGILGPSHTPPRSSRSVKRSKALHRVKRALEVVLDPPT